MRDELGNPAVIEIATSRQAMPSDHARDSNVGDWSPVREYVPDAEAGKQHHRNRQPAHRHQRDERSSSLARAKAHPEQPAEEVDQGQNGN
jgi:hypothetical protein